jgi:hypothetical protein
MQIRRYAARELIANGQPVACRDREVEFLGARIAAPWECVGSVDETEREKSS